MSIKYYLKKNIYKPINYYLKNNIYKPINYYLKNNIYKPINYYLKNNKYKPTKKNYLYKLVRYNLYKLIIKILRLENVRTFQIPFCVFLRKKNQNKLILVLHKHFGHAAYDYFFLCRKILKIKNLKCQVLYDTDYGFLNLDFKFKNRIKFSNNKILIFVYKMLYYICLNQVKFKKEIKLKKYFNRKFLQEKIGYSIPFDLNFKGNYFLNTLNIEDKKIITLYVRNDNYYYKYLKKKNKEKINLNDMPRNFEADVYSELIKKYSDKYFFIKLGYKDDDKTLDKYKFKNYFDFSNSIFYSRDLELFLLNKCHLTIQGESGTSILARMLQKKLMVINCTNPIINYPIMKNEITLLQKIFFKDKELRFIEDFKNLEIISQVPRGKYFSFIKNDKELVLDTFNIFDSKMHDQQISKNCIVLKKQSAKILQLLYKENIWSRKWFHDPDFIGRGCLFNIKSNTFDNQN